jgi:hypothetical protein
LHSGVPGPASWVVVMPLVPFLFLF